MFTLSRKERIKIDSLRILKLFLGLITVGLGFDACIRKGLNPAIKSDEQKRQWIEGIMLMFLGSVCVIL